MGCRIRRRCRRSTNTPPPPTSRYTERAGGSRTVSEGYVFDEFGRVVEHTAADGTVTTTTYDDTVPEGGVVPVGLPVLERTVAADGLVAESRHELNEDRTAVVAARHTPAPARTRGWSGPAGLSSSTRPGRVTAGRAGVPAGWRLGSQSLPCTTRPRPGCGHGHHVGDGRGGHRPGRDQRLRCRTWCRVSRSR